MPGIDNAAMKKKLSLILFVLLSYVSLPAAENTIGLQGKWQFAIDSLDRGVGERWYARTFTETVRLPGSMTENGKGSPVSVSTHWTGDILDSSYFTSPRYEKYRRPGSIKIPFWLQPDAYYCGAAWYRKKIVIPSEWKGRPVELFFERCHWESSVWIDDAFVGTQNALSAPHRFNLTEKISPGTHYLTVCVDNRIRDIDPGVNSSSLTDNSQTNWNGIVGSMFLSCAQSVSISSLHVFPDVHHGTIRVAVDIENHTSNNQTIDLSTQASCEQSVLSMPSPAAMNRAAIVHPGKNSIAFEYAMGKDALLWDEFSPSLYTLTCTVSARGRHDVKQTMFGMRTLGVRNTQITINERVMFLRGTLECAIFPRTGYPSTDVGWWTRIFTTCKQYGLNHMRFHSWCPPEAAFTAADRLGLYLYVECSSWANPGTSIGGGKPIDRYIMDESRRIVDAYGDHPSFCFLAYGNEPSGARLREYLTDFVEYWKKRDDRRLYSGASGWPVSDSSDFHVSYKPRIQHWAEGLKSILNSQAPSTSYDWSSYIQQYKVPVVSHEIGEWCAYPYFDAIQKYDGVLHAKNLEIFQESLADSGMGPLAKKFLDASGKLQVLCYKADIEAALRTKNMGGFQLLDLHDFPGQGSGLVGVLDPFWESKGYVTPPEYRQFCNTTVPLARMTKFIYTTAEEFTATVEVAHFGPEPLALVVPSWQVTDTSGAVVAHGEFQKTDIPRGNGFTLGTIRHSLASVPSPAMYTLEVSVGAFTNRWDFWVYPSRTTDPLLGYPVRVVRRWDDSTMEFLTNGGAVLFTPAKGTIKKEYGGDISVGFSSIFWNTAWTSKQPPHTLGILCDPRHPLFREFPTQYHSNYQWWDAMSHSNAIQLSTLGCNIEPLVRVIDDWFTNRPLGLIVEAKVGKGKLILSGIDLLTDIEKRAEARQLTNSILEYMRSGAFKPVQVIDPRTLEALCK